MPFVTIRKGRSSFRCAKVLRAMRITAFMLCAVCLHAAANSPAQKVTIKLRQGNLEQVFKAITKQTGYVFFYNHDHLKAASPVTINVKNVSVEQALDQCLKDQPLQYLIENKTVAISRKIILAKADEPLAPLPIKISGRILNAATRQPLQGATVMVKGSSRAVVSNDHGYFEIEVNSGNTLLISYVGFLSGEIRITANTENVVIELTPNTNSLHETVVIGYGTIKKSDVTGAVSSVKGEELAKVGLASFDQALQGRAAGVNVTSNSGLPGGGTTIRIRGIGSINSGNDPLFVIDGMPVGSGPNVANFINPDDIEQVEILKDASSAAIYGSQGANGVIIVTTKKGKAGSPKLSLNSFFGTKKLKETWVPGNAAQFGQVYLLAKKAAGAPINDLYDYYKPYYSMLDGIDFSNDYTNAQNNLYNRLLTDHPESTDWMNALFQTGVVQNYNLSLSGGTETFRYASSLGYYNEEGIIKTTNYDRLTFRLNMDYNVSQRLRLGTNISLVNSDRKGVNPLITNTNTGGLNFHSDNSILSQAYQIDPVTLIHRTAEQAALAGGDPANPYDLYSASLFTGTTNPVAGLARSNITYNQFQLLGSAFLEFIVLKGLVFKSTYGLNYSKGLESSYLPNYFISGNDRNLVNSVKRINDGYTSWDWINQLTYSKTFRRHNFTVIAAMDASKIMGQSITVSKTNTPSNAPGLQYLNNAIGNAAADDDIYESTLLSYLGRLNYSFAGKYLLTATFRRDGSSKFSSDYRWGNFSSFAAGYRISEEEYFKNLGLNIISNLKIRAGWGQLGNSAVPPYSNVSLYNATDHVTYPFGPVIPFSGGGLDNYNYQTLTQGVVPYKIGNTSLTWEKSEQSNIGIDLGFLNNRITFTADYFIKTSRDNLLQIPVPPNVGYAYSLPYSNSGKIENRGIELTLDYRDRAGDFTYNIGGNISFIKNKVLSLGLEDATYQHYGRRFSGIPYRTISGHPMADFYGFRTDGIFQTQAEIDAFKGAGGALLQPNAKPGDFKFANLKNDNALSDSDQVVLGSPLPKATYGFYFNLGYKGVDVDMFWQGQYGNKILMYEKYFIYRGQGNFNSINNLPSTAWHGPGTSNTQPRISANDPNDNFRMSDYYLEDGSYLRLKSLQVGYTLPTSLISALKIASVRIYVSAENLITITEFPGIDPELPSPDIQNMGFSSFEYPQPRTLRVGFRASF